MGCPRPWHPEGSWPVTPFLIVDLPSPDYQKRQALWAETLDQYALQPDEGLTTLAARFSLAAGQISDAARLAITRARARPPGAQALDQEDLNWAARARSSH